RAPRGRRGARPRRFACGGTQDMKGRPIQELSRDYLGALAAAARFNLHPNLRAKLAEYERFVARNAHRLGPFPGALREVALAEVKDSLVRKDVRRELKAKR